MAFQNPAQNFAEQRLSLGDLFTLSPHLTFLVRSDSNYPEADIMQGSVLVIARTLISQHRHIIVAEVNGELVLRKLLINPVPALQELKGDKTLACLMKAVAQEHAIWKKRQQPLPVL